MRNNLHFLMIFASDFGATANQAVKLLWPVVEKIGLDESRAFLKTHIFDHRLIISIITFQFKTLAPKCCGPMRLLLIAKDVYV